MESSIDPNLNLRDWVQHEGILHEYEQKHVTQLLPWQAECLSNDGVLSVPSRNVVFAAPTSAGKSLVAEVIAIQRLLQTRRKVLFVLPYVSLAREKFLHLQVVLRAAGIRVEAFMASLSPVGGFDSWDVGVCTIEKANTLINRLTETTNSDPKNKGYDLGSLSTVVVDELHIVGEGGRGHILEILLTKLIYFINKMGLDIKLVGMSATLSNLPSVATWLNNAVCYETTRRPVELTNSLKSDDKLYDRDMSFHRRLGPEFKFADDTDNVVGLCAETVSAGHGCLLFCATRAWTERLSESISRIFLKVLKDDAHPLCSAMRGSYADVAVFKAFIADYKQAVGLNSSGSSCIDPILRQTLNVGVAFHHAGLAMEEREMLERGFRTGIIKVLVATTTLSSGVNLPARRVIIRSPWGNPAKPGPCLTSAAYQQMVGRAGRKGYDEIGESIMVCSNSAEVERAKSLMNTSIQPVASTLASCDDSGKVAFASRYLCKVLLEGVASGLVGSFTDLNSFLSSTLMSTLLQHELMSECASSDDNGISNLTVIKSVSSVIEYLTDNEFISVQDTVSTDSDAIKCDRLLKPSQLGLAAFCSALSPDEALYVFKDLQRARKHLVLESELHLIYLVTPLSLTNSWYGNFNWSNFYNLYIKLGPDARYVASVVGVKESFLCRAANGQTIKDPSGTLGTTHRRFYVSLILNDLANEHSVADVAIKYECSRGFLQSLQQQASSYSGMVVSFADALGWVYLKRCLSGLSERLLFGIRRDLAPLVRIDGVDGSRARAFHNNGYKTIASLARATPNDIIGLLRKAVPFKSSLSSQAKAQSATTTSAAENKTLLNTWLSGHDPISEEVAAELILRRANQLLADDLKAIGLDSLPLTTPSISVQPHFDSSDSDQRTKPVVKVDVDLPVRFENALRRVSQGPPTAMSTPNTTVSPREQACMVDSDSGVTSSSDAAASDTSIGESDENVNNIKPDSEEPEANNDKAMDIEPTVHNHSVTPEETRTVLRSEPPGVTTRPGVGLPKETGPAIIVPDTQPIVNTDEESDSIFDNLNATTISLGRVSISGRRRSVEIFDSSDNNGDILNRAVSSQNLVGVLDMTTDAVIPEARNLINYHDKTVTSKIDVNTKLIKCPPLSNNHVSRNDTLKRTHSNARSPLPIRMEDIQNEKDIFSVDTGTDADVGDKTLGELLLTSFATQEANNSKQTNIEVEPQFTAIKTSGTPNFRSPPKRFCSGTPELSGADDTLLNVPLNVDEFDDCIAPSQEPCSSIQFTSPKPNFSPNLGSKRKSMSTEHSSVVSGPAIGTIGQSKSRSHGKTLVYDAAKPTLKRKVHKSILKQLDNVKGSTSVQQSSTTLSIGSAQFAVINLDSFAKCVEFSETLSRCNLVAISAARKQTQHDVTKDEFPFVMFQCESNLYILDLKPTQVATTKPKCKGKPPASVSLFGTILNALGCVERIVFWNFQRFLSILPDQSFKDFISSCLAPSETIAKPPSRSDSVSLTPLVSSNLLCCSHAIWLLDPDKGCPDVFESACQLGVINSEKANQFRESIAGNQGQIPTNKSIQFAALECITSHALAPRLPNLLSSGQISQKCLNSSEIPAMITTLSMQRTGFPLDAALCRALHCFLERVMCVLEDSAASHLNGRRINLSSPTDVARALFTELKLPPDGNPASTSTLLQQNKRGGRHHYSTSKGVLQSLASLHQLPTIILEWRIAKNALTTGTLPLLKYVNRAKQTQDGGSTGIRIKGSFDLFTATGRAIMHGPSLQTMPKDFLLTSIKNLDVPTTLTASHVAVNSQGGLTISIRSILKTDPGHCFLTADFSQIELRILAHMSDDTQLQKAFRSDADIFKTIAGAWKNKACSEITDNERQEAKGVCYGIIYGMGAKALAETLNIDEAAARQCMSSFKAAYPGISVWMLRTLADCRSTGYVRTIAGRIRKLPDINSYIPQKKAAAERQAINTTVQGSAADVFKAAMSLVFREICIKRKLATIVLQMHDELVLEVSDSAMASTARLLKSLMESAVNLRIPTPVKVKAGHSWGALVSFDE